jgi:hypothetical protein
MRRQILGAAAVALIALSAGPALAQDVDTMTTAPVEDDDEFPLGLLGLLGLAGLLGLRRKDSATVRSGFDSRG